MAKQLEILRNFKDDYLVPHAAGKKLMDLCSNVAKTIARYVESHPWLKGSVRIVFYPMIGFAWLIGPASIFVKGIIGVCIILAFAGLLRRLRFRSNRS